MAGDPSRAETRWDLAGIGCGDTACHEPSRQVGETMAELPCGEQICLNAPEQDAIVSLFANDMPEFGPKLQTNGLGKRS